MPASIKFVPRYIRGAIAALERDMPAQVAAFNLEPDNTVELEVPASYHFGATDRHAAFPFPQVEVAAVQGQTGRFEINRRAVDHDVILNVVVWLEGTTGEVGPVYEQLLGMARCVIEILTPTDAIAAGAEISNERGVYWRVSEAIPLDQDDENRTLQKWRVPVFVQLRIEDVEEFA